MVGTIRQLKHLPFKMELDQFFLSHSFKVCVQNFLVRIFVKAKQKEFGRTIENISRPADGLYVVSPA